MLRLGCAILTLWLSLNLIPSTVIVFNTMTLRGHTPALYSILSREDVGRLDAETLATLDSIAVFANGTNIGFCTLALFVTWLGLARRKAWAFWGLLAGLCGALFAGFAADYMVGTVAPHINVISALILAFGFAFAGWELFFNRPAKTGEAAEPGP